MKEIRTRHSVERNVETKTMKPSEQQAHHSCLMRGGEILPVVIYPSEVRARGSGATSPEQGHLSKVGSR